MDEISQSGATVVFVNHGIEAIKDYCDHAIVLDKGKLVLDTTNIDEAIALYLAETP
jgi:ABC-type polysaccharide/polyol phosphate transport system ATPase subunit